MYKQSNGAYRRRMTPRRDLAVPQGQVPETVEQLRARVTELEQQLRSRTPATQTKPHAHTPEWQPVAIVMLAGTVLVTALLAALTVKRWWHWWSDL